MKLFAIILTYNEASHIVDCIASAQFADEVVVFDSYSTDETISLAESAGAQVFQNPFENYAQQRNAALESVAGRADWVLFVDADERVTPELAQEVRGVISRPGYAGWRIPRLNYLFGRLTRGAGWYPDHQTRLLRVGSARYDPGVKVHEVVQLDGELGTMTEHFIHYNYRDIVQFHEKQRRYVQLDARILFEQGVRPRWWTPYTQPLRHFYWRFIALRGVEDGWHGLRLSALMAWYEWQKYAQLRQLWRENERGAWQTPTH